MTAKNPPAATQPLSEWPEDMKRKLIIAILCGTDEENALPPDNDIPLSEDQRERLEAIMANAIGSKEYQVRMIGEIMRILPPEYQQKITEIRKRENREPSDISGLNIPCKQLYFIRGLARHAENLEEVTKRMNKIALLSGFGVFHTEPNDPSNWQWPNASETYKKIVDMLARFEDYTEEEK